MSYSIRSPIVAGNGNIEIVCKLNTDIVLAGATSQFFLFDRDGNLVIQKSATVNAVQGTATVLITKDETAVLLGDYRYNFEVTDTQGNLLTFRENGSFGRVKFIRDLPDA